ncbi:MAG TPA: hypothetical protein VG408_03775, partial [Actinomycetota bacterium]|nr:hypothetical protein [Actinomycetota bacterium]
MQRIVVAVIAGTILVAAGVTSSAKSAVRFGADRERILDSRDVVLTLENNTDRRIELFGGTVRDMRKDELQIRLEPERRFLPPEGVHSWTWIHEGDAGRFVARF